MKWAFEDIVLSIAIISDYLVGIALTLFGITLAWDFILMNGNWRLYSIQGKGAVVLIVAFGILVVSYLCERYVRPKDGDI